MREQYCAGVETVPLLRVPLEPRDLLLGMPIGKLARQGVVLAAVLADGEPRNLYGDRFVRLGEKLRVAPGRFRNGLSDGDGSGNLEDALGFEPCSAMAGRGEREAGDELEEGFGVAQPP